jgi:hypothetical protein
VIAGRAAGRIQGAAPGAKLVPLRTIKSVVQVFDGDVGIAIERARQAGCDVVSMSLGGVGFSGSVRDAIRTAVESGMIVMAAAGNEVGFVTAPASWPECLAIGATVFDGQPWRGSSRGPEVDFCAPGGGIWVARAKRDEQGRHFDVLRGDGTSFAVAHTAGVAALWLRFHGAQQLRRRYGRPNVQRLFVTLARKTAHRPAGWDSGRFGAGILDARALLDEPLPDRSTFARPTRAAGPSPRPSPLDRLATLWPELTKAEVRTRLGASLGKRGKGLDELLERFGGELFYQFSQDPELRAGLDRQAGAMAATGAPAAGSRELRRVASRALAGELES